MLEPLLQHPFTLRLGWTLLHSLWQGLALTALLLLALLLVGQARHRLRQSITGLALGIWLAAPTVTFLVLANPPVGSTPPVTAPALNQVAPPLLLGNTEVRLATEEVEVKDKVETIIDSARSSAASILPDLRGLLPYAALTWLATASLLCLRLLGGLALVQRLTRVGTPLAELQVRVDTLAKDLGIRKRVRLLASAGVDAPTAMGFLRPVVLLPSSAITGLTPAQLELILAHELAHIRRNDYLLNILQGIAEALLFYHPLTWWLTRLLRTEREHACDDLALKATGSPPLDLAEALTRLETSRPAPVPILSATGNLAPRIRRLLKTPQSTSVRTATVLPTLTISLFGCWLAFAAHHATAESNWSVVIDPAHSDILPGADGPIAEADLTLAVAKKARDLLEQHGVEVLLTRESGEGLADTYAEDVEARAAMATAEHQAFITLHAEFASTRSTHGIETFIHPSTSIDGDGRDHRQASRHLAEVLQKHLIQETGARDRRVKENQLAQLRLPQTPAAYVSLGFLSNQTEAARLASHQYQELLARGLAQGILAYLTATASPTGEQDRAGHESSPRPTTDPAPPASASSANEIAGAPLDQLPFRFAWAPSPAPGSTKWLASRTANA